VAACDLDQWLQKGDDSSDDGDDDSMHFLFFFGSARSALDLLSQ
jgi:hypothetical protein